MSLARGLAGLLALAATVACAKVASPPARGLLLPRRLSPTPSDAIQLDLADARVPARSHLLGTIAHQSIGPFAARSNGGGLAAWIVPAEGGMRANLIAVPFGTDGAPLRDPRIVAEVPREATSLLVRPAAGGHEGWLVVWSALLDRGESLTMLGLSLDATVVRPPTELERTSDHLTWTDALPTNRGALLLWTEEPAVGDANILAAAIGPDGTPLGRPIRVARGVERWAAVRAGDGAALALVVRAKDSPAGLLSWLRLDSDGNARGAPIAVGKEATVSGRIDVVPFRDGSLLAWTDATGEDPQVTLAAIDAAGSIQGPTRAMDAVGGSSLVTLAAGAGGIALAWESPHGRTRPWNLLHLAKIRDEPGLSAQPVTSFEVEARAATELVSAGDGFALLTVPVPACQSSHPSATSYPGDCFAVPMFLRCDAHLAPVQAEPLWVGKPSAAAALAWGLRCDGEHCVTLASLAEAPTPVFAIDLPPRKSPFDAPAAAMPIGSAMARATGLVTIESGKPYIDMAATRVGDATLVATMAPAEGAAPDRASDRSESIAVRAFGADGRSIDSASTLTARAVAVGRVAIAAAPRAEDGAGAAWVARRNTGGEIHVAHLDRRGHRIKEVAITAGQGDASSVAIAWAADGWLVAWVDWRDGNGEVYAAKLDRNLNRVAPDRRITRAPGDAADVSLAAQGETAWLAWSDPRESPREGVGDIYVTVLDARNAKRTGGEVRVLATAAHSRSPTVVVAGDGALVAWIEDTPTGLDAPGAAMVARLAPSGQVVEAARTLTLAGEGRPTAIVLEPSPSGANAIVARSGHDWVTIDALEMGSNGAAGPAWPVVDLDAPAPFDVALALAGNTLFYDDTGGTAGRRRVRRLAIAW